MEKNKPGLVVKLSIIISFLCLIVLFASVYRGINNTLGQTSDEQLVLKMIKYLDKAHIAHSEVVYYEKPLLVYKYPEKYHDFENACIEARLQADSLKQLCLSDNPVIPCDDILRLDSVLNKNLALSRQTIRYGLSGELDSAVILGNSVQYEQSKIALRDVYNEIATHGRLSLNFFQERQRRNSRNELFFLGLVIILMLCFLAYLFWRLKAQLNGQERILSQYRAFKSSSDGFLITDSDFTIIYVNDAVDALLSLQSRGIIGLKIGDIILDIQPHLSGHLLNKGETSSFDFLDTISGKWIRLSIFPWSEGFSFHLKDITSIILADEEAKKSRQLYEFISKINDLILYAGNEEAIFNEICQIAVNSGNFMFAWIGRRDPETNIIKPVQKAGKENGYLDTGRVSALDIPEGNGPTGKAFRLGNYYYCNDIEHDPAMGIWKQEALDRGFRSSISLPIKTGNKVVAVLTMYSGQPFIFTTQEIQLMVRVADNISYALNAFDIDRKRLEAEKELIKVTRAIEQSSASIVITNLKGDIEYVNPAFSKLTGYTEEEVLGQNPRVLKSGHTTDSEYEHLWEDITHYKEWQGEFLNKKKNGETYWEYATISPIVNEKGEITHFVAVKENITERKKLEAEQNRLLAIIENTTAYVAISDMQRNLIYANKAFRNALEISEDPKIKYNFNDFRTQQEKMIVEEMNKALIENGKWTGENRYISNVSAKSLPVLQVVVAHKDENGEISHVSMTAIDISRIKEVEMELMRVNNELREFSKYLQYVRETEKNRIAKAVHDELGQGLAALKFDVSWIRKHLDDERPLIEAKMDEVLDSISDKLTAFRKIYVSANTTMLEEIGINASAEYLVSLFTKSSGIPILYTSGVESERVPASVSKALYRILEEGLTNAVNYAKASRISVKLQQEGADLVFEIEDNGCGFDMSELDMKIHHGILEMRERAYAINGNFLISSETGKGTVISIRIPQ